MSDFITYHSDTLYYYIALPFAVLVVGAMAGHAFSRTSMPRVDSIFVGAILGVVFMLLFELWRYTLSLYWFEDVSLDTAFSLGLSGVMFVVLSFFFPIVPLAAVAGAFWGYLFGGKKKLQEACGDAAVPPEKSIREDGQANDPSD